ncbi:hypothetical protein ANI02nite_13200 [Acetobacter nitrogenifigens DSM 23921 = NBRC 105050]|uniref:Uncharacterized protein n=1 Tax=Acetobacter nitrogenifigens DSM 23921 = NBRC 105050 TaxID=1120919 RepID=A0A511X910_9PROT|nr:hypothetical protein ANI02nite_13200 [Acetobacter nitrogenifigens DSM 23921 = NBRC 105050]
MKPVQSQERQPARSMRLRLRGPFWGHRGFIASGRDKRNGEIRAHAFNKPHAHQPPAPNLHHPPQWRRRRRHPVCEQHPIIGDKVVPRMNETKK